MLKKLLEINHEMPITTQKHATFKYRNSQQSLISSTNSVSLTSVKNIEPPNQEPKHMKRQARSSQMNFYKNNSKMAQLNENQRTERDVLEQKLQNVSCLYSNFIYKKSQKNFIDDMKLERYRIMVENERVQKNKLLKQIDEMKDKIKQTQKQKQTVIFAYRALQNKIKEKQARAKLKMKSRQRKQKLSIIMSQGIPQGGSGNSLMFEDQLMKSRKMLTCQEILCMSQEQENQQFMVSLNKFCSSNSICKYLENKDGIKQWQQKEKKFTEMETQLMELRQKVPVLIEKKQFIEAFNVRLVSENKYLKQQHGREVKKASFLQNELKKLQQKMQMSQSENISLQTRMKSINTKMADQEKQVQRKQVIIKELQDTKYTYLMRQQKQKQQIELLKRFTENLQLNDDKINEFIQSTFGNQVQTDIKSQRKLFNEDISYILHLIKKKQNIYNEIIKEYQEKHRQTETRCFLLQKKLHLTDNFLSKLQSFTAEQVNIKPSLTQDNKDMSLSEKINQRSKLTYEKPSFVQMLQGILETYKLDRRII